MFKIANSYAHSGLFIVTNCSIKNIWGPYIFRMGIEDARDSGQMKYVEFPFYSLLAKLVSIDMT